MPKKHIGPLAISVSGKRLSEKERQLIAHGAVGMVVLFRENWDAKGSNPKARLKALTHEIHSINPNIIIAADQEGRRVQRFREGFTELPSAKDYGLRYDKDPEKALKYAFEQGHIMASELLDCGVDICLGPVLDLHTDTSRVIGKLERAFHADPKVVVRIASAFIQGMNAAGMPATGKHFPGHGSCESDSHVARPVDNRSLKLLENDLYPFKILMERGLLDAVMAAHVIYPAVDPKHPAGFSSIWIQDILRKDCDGEDICVMSDCLTMKGADVGSALERIVAAQKAGCDFLMLTHQHGPLLTSLLEILDKIPDSEASAKRRMLFASKIQRREVTFDLASLDSQTPVVAEPVYANHILQEEAIVIRDVGKNDEERKVSKEQAMVLNAASESKVAQPKTQEKNQNKDRMRAEIGFDVDNNDYLHVFIDTERLHMSSVVPTEKEDYRKLYADAEVMKKYIFGVPLSKEESDMRVDIWTKAWAAQDPFSAFSVFKKHEDPFIGNIGIRPAPEKNAAELFYIYHKQVDGKPIHGQGYGGEGAEAVVKDYAPELERRGVPMTRRDGTKEPFKGLYAVAREDNPASWKILEAVGLKHEETVEKYGAKRRVYRGAVPKK